MQYKVITYYDNMEDDVEIYDNKDEAINRVHHLRGVKYRNARLYKVEMVEFNKSDVVVTLTGNGYCNQVTERRKND